MSRKSDSEAELIKRRVPCIVAYVSPFRIINTPEALTWQPTVDEINSRSWDYVALHEVIGGVDVGLEPPYHVAVSRDGAIALPPLPQFRALDAAVEFINRFFAALLLGGIYCESVGQDGIDFGFVLDWKYMRVMRTATAQANEFHRMIRMRQASPLQAIHLLSPRSIDLREMTAAFRTGREILDKVGEVRPEFLLRGVTGFTRRDWGAALSNMWVVVEQLTAHLWESKVVASVRIGDLVPGRVDQLADARTWTTAARHEVLCRIGAIDTSELRILAQARRARNALAHAGRHPVEAEASAAYMSALALLRRATPEVQIPLCDLDLSDHKISDPFSPPDAAKLEPSLWMAIPKLPGEEELERLFSEERHGPQSE